MWQLRRPWQRWGRWSEPAGHWDVAAVAAADGVDGDAHDSVCDACGDGAAADDAAVAGDGIICKYLIRRKTKQNDISKVEGMLRRGAREMANNNKTIEDRMKSETRKRLA